MLYASGIKEISLWEIIKQTKLELWTDDMSALPCLKDKENVLYTHETQDALLQMLEWMLLDIKANKSKQNKYYLDEYNETNSFFNVSNEYLSNVEWLLSRGWSHVPSSFNTNYTINDSIPIKYLETMGHMFIYWNLCPQHLVSWTPFFGDLIQNAPSHVIIQTLNILLFNL